MDYVARYNQEVLHDQPTNWGNVILIGLVVLLALGGAYFVNRREGWVSISLYGKETPGQGVSRGRGWHCRSSSEAKLRFAESLRACSRSPPH